VQGFDGDLIEYPGRPCLTIWSIEAVGNVIKRKALSLAFADLDFFLL
jgi:hypothetical protein